MKKSAWNLALDQVKKQEKPETVLMVAGSTELTRLTVAWIGVKTTRRKKLTDCAAKDNENVWHWLWDNTTFPQEQFYSRISGNRNRAESNFAMLVANRVIYPDGTVNSFVARYLREKVLSLFGISKSKDKTAA